MPIFSLSLMWTVLIDILAWTFFHIFISFVCFKMPLTFFQRNSFWFQIYPWEQSGRVWQRWFRVKKWKSSLVDGTVLFRKGYTKKNLHGTNKEELKTFAAETKRAELTHWLSIVPAPLFFLWNPVWAGWVMILYAFVFNLPFILVQRYNRGRITAITEHSK